MIWHGMALDQNFVPVYRTSKNTSVLGCRDQAMFDDSRSCYTAAAKLKQMELLRPWFRIQVLLHLQGGASIYMWIINIQLHVQVYWASPWKENQKKSPSKNSHWRPSIVQYPYIIHQSLVGNVINKLHNQGHQQLECCTRPVWPSTFGPGWRCRTSAPRAWRLQLKMVAMNVTRVPCVVWCLVRIHGTGSPVRLAVHMP